MKQWLWPDLQAIVDFHHRLIDIHGGLHGVKDQGALEGAMARPQHRAAYQKPDAAELAAAFAFGLAKAHAFNDGNKRAAWATARLFLIKNGYKLVFTKDDAIDAMLRLTAGEISEADMAAWFRKRL